MNPQKASSIDTDIAAIGAELQALQAVPAATEKKHKPKRSALPAELPRTLIHHEPDNARCPCGCALKRVGEDVSEKLDYTPGVFTVERQVRGKWVCYDSEILIQAPVPAQGIDKGIPTADLLARVMSAKFADHLPLCRQELIFGRAGLDSTLNPGSMGWRDCSVATAGRCAARRGTRAAGFFMPMKHPCSSYVWAYATSQFSDVAAVVYDVHPSRAGEHARNFLQAWRGKLVCDDIGGYKASFGLGVT